MIDREYDHIWDCCCDHGFLGAQLLKRNAAKTIHFVDVVADLMLVLESKLQRFLPDNMQSDQQTMPKWKVHCIDVAMLPLTQYKNNDTHLIIIAGIGGDLLIELVSQILANHPDKHLEFILCPVHHNYKVRSQVSKHKLGLLHECLIKENKRFYEIMHLSTQSSTPVSHVGSQMWDLARDDDRDYLTKTLEHYRRMQQYSPANHVDIEQIISQYQAVNKLNREDLCAI